LQDISAGKNGKNFECGDINICFNSGPYMFGVSFLTYLCSKEIYVMEHEYYNGLSLAILCIVFVKKVGPTIAKALDKEVDVSHNFNLPVGHHNFV